MGRKDASTSLFVDLNVSLVKKKAKIKVLNLKPFNTKKKKLKKEEKGKKKRKFLSEYSKDITHCPLHEDVTVMAFLHLD